MQNEPWKDALSKLSLDELRKAHCFIMNLIKASEMVLKSKEEPIVQFPTVETTPIDEMRKDKRFDMDIEGVCSLVKRADETLDEIPIRIKDISKSGVRFITDKSLTPSSILVIKFSLPSANSDRLLYKNPQKKIYAEVRRVIEFSAPTGIKYQIGAKAIENESAMESLKEKENRLLISKRLALKGDMRILIVSMKGAQSESLEETLLKQGYVVYKANQKQQAIALLRKNKCNLVVSDMDTAKINEFELLEDIKEEFPEVGLIIEIDTMEDWAVISSLGVDDYLTKNFDNKEFDVVLELFHKKLLNKSMFANYFRKRRQDNLNILVVSGDEALRRIFCNIAKENGLSLYFVRDREHAMIVLRRYKIDLTFVDAEFTGLTGCELVASAKKDFPTIDIVVISKNLQGRYDFFSRGADSFIVGQIDAQKILGILG